MTAPVDPSTRPAVAGQPRFPFTAVVGQDELKVALLLAAVDPRIGGVLLRGQKGSAKTTLARALAALLPGDAPFAELPLGATEDRLVGTLDLAAALTGGERRFEPGLLAAAHGGVLYVDEVNLLPDHLVDVLLDVAASGVNRVEREGISYQHSARFVLIGSMNPEEGELRPQLLDRFGLAVTVTAPTEPAVRAEAVRRRLAFDAAPAAFAARWAAPEDELQRRLVTARPAPVHDRLLMAITTLCAQLGAEGLRADLVMTRAIAALAGWEGRPAAGPDDVRRVAGLALAHRRRRGPFDDPALADEDLQAALDQALAGLGDLGLPPTGTANADRPDPPATARSSGTAPGASGANPDPGPDEAEPDGSAGDGNPETGHDPADGRATPHLRLAGGSDRDRDRRADGADRRRQQDDRDWPRAVPDRRADGGADRSDPPEQVVADRDARPGPAGVDDRPGTEPAPEPMPTPATVTRLAAGRAIGGDRAGGRRDAGDSPRGRLVGDRPVAPGEAVTSVALGATVRAVAARRQGGGGEPGDPVQRDDLRQAVRRQRAGALVVLAVDASGSMGADRRLEAAKGAVVGLLLDAYQRRDRVAVVTFAGETAQVVLRPTGSVEVARNRLTELPSGGRTPLAAGIETALAVATSGASAAGMPSGGHQRPLLVLVTDGRATWAPPGVDPVEAAHLAAERVRVAGVPAAVIDAESGPTMLGLARRLAARMGASYHHLGDLAAPELERAVRAVLPS
jgi:magnesium chelatase subunit D